MKLFRILLGVVWLPWLAVADCTLTNLNITPLPDRAYEFYKGLPGGLYPNFSNNPPPAHFAAGLNIATNEINPLDANGNEDEATGKIVMTSIGMSNTTQEFASKGPEAFKRRADADPAKNPRLIIVDGAQGGQPSTSWTNRNSSTWNNVHTRLANAGVNSNQVQVLWMKQARKGPPNNFPTHAQLLQADLEQIMRNAKFHFPNLKIAYVSSRTRCYSVGSPESTLNPEPQAFESAFSVKWMIEKQINGDTNLNFNPAQGAVVAPLILWGPYLWADGTVGRSDGFIWRCNDLETDLTHPNTNGTAKVGAQLLAFFKTDPTATPWFLKNTVIGQPPTCTISAEVTHGVAPLTVNFSADASDADGTIRDYQWTFDDGTFATNANPTKIFKTPGTYTARVTATDNDGNTVMRSVTISVAAVALANASISGNQFQMNVLGATNYNYVVQRSDDLTDWISVITNRGPFTFTSTNLGLSRFYRAVLEPP
jgi:hypothetical protein